MKNNVLFLVVDCLRSDYVDLNGKRAKGLTPFIEDFSRRGVSFEQAITQSSWTKTSVASILTGTYPFTHNVHKILHRIPKDLPTIAEIYKKNGFETGYFTSNPYLSPGTGYDRGFNVRRIIGEDDGKLLNKEVLSSISQNKNNPFFFYVQYMETHQPYKVHSEERKAEKEKIMRKYDTGIRSTGKVNISKEDFKLLKELYADEVKYSDKVIKQLIDYLRGKGLLEKTLVLISADHGTELLEHGGLYHGARLYNEMLAVPLIIVGPGIEKGKFIRGRVRSVDLMPTLLEYSNLPVPDSVQGVSLKSYMCGDDDNSCILPAYAQRERSHEQLMLSAFFDDCWKLISYKKERQKVLSTLSLVLKSFFKGQFAMVRDSFRAGSNYFKRKLKGIFQKKDKRNEEVFYELFDLSIDPDEQNNLSVENEKKLEEMKKKMEDFLEEKEVFSSTDDIEIDKTVEKRLKDLGYLD